MPLLPPPLLPKSASKALLSPTIGSESNSSSRSGSMAPRGSAPAASCREGRHVQQRSGHGDNKGLSVVSSH